MRIRCRPVAMVLAVAASLASLSLTGCDTIERETGFNRETQTGALGGAAFGGIVSALADANPAWIAASVILGGVAGGAVGNYLGKDNAERHAENNLKALDTLGDGRSATWRDAHSGNSGTTTVNKVKHTTDGTVCKSYTEIVRTSVKTVSQQATACKPPGGRWRIQVT